MMWIESENGCVITCSECGERLEFCYPDGTEVRRLPHCPWCGAIEDNKEYLLNFKKIFNCSEPNQLANKFADIDSLVAYLNEKAEEKINEFSVKPIKIVEERYDWQSNGEIGKLQGKKVFVNEVPSELVGKEEIIVIYPDKAIIDRLIYNSFVVENEERNK